MTSTAAPRYNARMTSDAINVVMDPHIENKVTPRDTASSTSPVVYL